MTPTIATVETDDHRIDGYIVSTPIASSVWFHDELRKAVRTPPEYDMLTEYEARCRSARETAETDAYRKRIGFKAQLLLPIRPTCSLSIEQAIYCDFGVLMRLLVTPELLQQSDPEQQWVNPRNLNRFPAVRRQILLHGYTTFGVNSVIDNVPREISWGFISRFADIAYVPVPDFGLDIVQRSFDVPRLQSLAAR